MNKVMLVLLLLVCSLGYAVLAVDAPATTPAEDPLPTTKVNPKDGAEMILIPAGEFLMGKSDSDKFSRSAEKSHKVNLDSYYIYKTEVTVSQYSKFCVATGKEMPKKPKLGWIDTHPVVNVTWNDAKAYADWAGVVLPTEAQWEKAARGGDGLTYPWGNKWDKLKCANWENSNGKGDTTKGTHPVGSFPTGASPYGVMDMAGNVWEWCADWYDASYYYKNEAGKNPTGPITGKYRVLRGGSWYDRGDFGNNNYFLRCSYREGSKYDANGVYHSIYDYPVGDGGIIGFRCASPVP